MYARNFGRNRQIQYKDLLAYLLSIIIDVAVVLHTIFRRNKNISCNICLFKKKKVTKGQTKST